MAWLKSSSCLQVFGIQLRKWVCMVGTEQPWGWRDKEVQIQVVSFLLWGLVPWLSHR